MAKKKRKPADRKPPKVRIAAPKNRPLQVRYFCKTEDREIRISVGSKDMDDALQLKQEIEAKLLLGIEVHSDRTAIRPRWIDGKHPVLEIPAAMQKNDTEEDIPLLPAFEKLLLQIPESKRTGWVFEPLSLQLKLGRKVRHQRPDAEWVGKVISRIGEKAKIEVAPADERTGTKVKYASAHDLRRSCGERLRNSGVPPLVICRVMRHASWETTRRHYAPGDIQKDADVLHRVLTVEPDTDGDSGEGQKKPA